MSPLQSVWNEYREATAAFSRPARLLLAAEFLAWTAHGIHQVLYNLYLVEGGFLEAFVGRTLSLQALGLALAALPAGVLADRWGRRRALILGIALEGAGLLVRSAVLDVPAIYVGSFIQGIGQALLIITAAPFITEHSTPKERTHLFTAFFAVSLSAGVVGSLLGGALPTWLAQLPGSVAPAPIMAYRLTLLLGAAVSFAGLAPLLRMGDLGETPIRNEARAAPPEAKRRLLPIALNAFLLGSGAGLVIPFMNLYFASRFESTSAEIGVYFSVAQVITVIAALLGPPFARRFGKLRTATTFELLSLPFLVTLGFERHLELAVGAFWLRAMLMQASTPLHHAFVMEALPRSLRARSMSINSTVWHGGWAVSTTCAGLIIERFGYAVPFYITAVLYFSAAMSLFLYFRRLPEIAMDDVPPAQAAAMHGEGPITE